MTVLRHPKGGNYGKTQICILAGRRDVDRLFRGISGLHDAG